MSRLFITGSTDGLGLLTAELLVSQGHQVVLHARNSAREVDVKRRLPTAEAVVTGDLSSIAQTRSINDESRQDRLIDFCGRLSGIVLNRSR